MKRFTREWLITIGLFAVIVAIFGRYLVFNETRMGAVLDDPLLALLPSRDLAWPIFIGIYGLLLGALWTLRYDTARVRVGVQAYTLLTVFRMTAMYLTPLEIPAGLIVLRDPFVENVTGGAVFTKDLFFSGHTSLLFLAALTVPKWKVIFYTGAAIVASMLLVQHAHYTVDVFAAPFFSYVALRTVETVHLKYLSRP
ncbi:MAG: phosphatase PAP2-related protein [Bdellovibrionia bacterium]